MSGFFKYSPDSVPKITVVMVLKFSAPPPHPPTPTSQAKIQKMLLLFNLQGFSLTVNFVYCHNYHGSYSSCWKAKVTWLKSYLPYYIFLIF